MLLIAWNVLCWSFCYTKDKTICTIQYFYRTLACIWLALILKTVCNAVDLISLDSFVTYNVYTPIIQNWHVFNLNYFHLLANLNALLKKCGTFGQDLSSVLFYLFVLFFVRFCWTFFLLLKQKFAMDFCCVGNFLYAFIGNLRKKCLDWYLYAVVLVDVSLCWCPLEDWW